MDLAQEVDVGDEMLLLVFYHEGPDNRLVHVPLLHDQDRGAGRSLRLDAVDDCAQLQKGAIHV